jgi:hypothetical protein
MEEKRLDDATLNLIRRQWGAGIGLLKLAEQHGLPLRCLESQLAEQRERLNPRDRADVVAALQRQIAARQRWQRGRREGGGGDG